MSDTCARCGGVRPEDLTAAERTAIANGWTLGDFRAAQLQIAAIKPAAVARRAEAARIPAAPDPWDAIRTARGQTATRPAIASPAPASRARAADSGIPAPPDPHALIRAAARR